MRAYFFGNMYLSSIQQGIQAGHVISELFCKYPYRDSGRLSKDGHAGEKLRDWANYHKTMILLNGGYLETMEDLWTFLDKPENPYPFEKFHEGLDSLGGVLTSIGIVLPEKIYLTAAAIRRDRPKRGEKSIAEFIMENERWVVFQDNEYGFTLQDDEDMLTLPFTKWEFDLMNRLNGFGLAS